MKQLETTESTHQQLQVQVQDLRGQLIHFEKRTMELNTEKSQYQELIDNLKSENLSLKLELNERKLNIDRLDELKFPRNL